MPLNKDDTNFHLMASQEEFKDMNLVESEDLLHKMNKKENFQDISSGLNAIEEETKEVKKDLNVYVNYDMLGGLEQIVECDEEDADLEAN